MVKGAGHPSLETIVWPSGEDGRQALLLIFSWTCSRTLCLILHCSDPLWCSAICCALFCPHWNPALKTLTVPSAYELKRATVSSEFQDFVTAEMIIKVCDIRRSVSLFQINLDFSQVWAKTCDVITIRSQTKPSSIQIHVLAISPNQAVFRKF